MVNVKVRCPHCGKINTMPETAGVYVTCSRCGKKWYTQGIEVIDKESSRIYQDFDKQDKQEIEAGKEKD
jgi:hypothetical protein